MFLSLVELNPQNMYVVRSITDEEFMHRNIMTLFNGNRVEEEVLYTSYVDKKNGVLKCIIQSKNQPVISEKSQGVLNISSRDINDYEGLIKKGAIVRFSFTASLCKQISRKGKNSSKQYISNPEERMAWLKEKALNNGFQILRIMEKPCIKKDFFHEKNRGVLRGNQYTGTLMVTDEEKFTALVKSGIGAGKPYGFGMFLLTA